MSEPEDTSGGAFAFFLNSGEPPTEDDQAAWRAIRDEAFPIPVVCGSEPPKFSMQVTVCDAGCHTRVYVVDEANDEQYLTHQMPVFVAQMSNMVDAEGHPNPTMELAAMRRLQSSLN
jgi:hypothetical protein